MNGGKHPTLQQPLANLPGWLRVDGKLVKSFSKDDFHSAVLFVQRVATAAAAVERYPDVSIRSDTVTIAFPFDDRAGLPARTGTFAGGDLAFARRIQRLVGDHHHPVGLAGA
jgi:pterin-4a-carbinolamine dehydratase